MTEETKSSEFTGHSPEPWQWVAPKRDLDFEGPLGRLIDANGKDICDFGDDTQYYPTAGSEPVGPDRRLIVAAPKLLSERDELQRFKDYVHYRLDEAGVPVDPDSPHKAEGCRIGGRLDVLIAKFSQRQPDVLEYPAMCFNALVARHGLKEVLKDIAYEFEKAFNDGTDDRVYVSGCLKDAADAMADAGMCDGNEPKERLMGKMNVNGVTYDVPPGASVSVVNGVVTINGQPATTYPQPANLIINITGDVGQIEAAGSVNVSGNSGNVRADGSVTVKGSTSYIMAGGSIECGDVSGDASAGGSVRCGKVGGGVRAGGSVRHG